MLIASGILTLIFVLFLVVVGFVANILVKIQIALTVKFFNEKVALFVVDRFTILGVVVHELSHALALLVTFAKIEEISFWDGSKSETLGHVSYRNRGNRFIRGMQDALCACAPTAVGLWLLYIQIRIFVIYKLDWWCYTLLGYGILSTIDHMSMSSIDLKNYFRGVWAPAVVIYVASLLYVYYVLKWV